MTPKAHRASASTQATQDSAASGDVESSEPDGRARCLHHANSFFFSCCRCWSLKFKTTFTFTHNNVLTRAKGVLGVDWGQAVTIFITLIHFLIMAPERFSGFRATVLTPATEQKGE